MRSRGCGRVRRALSGLKARLRVGRVDSLYSESKLSAITIKRAGVLVRRYDLVNAQPTDRRHLELSEIILQGAGSVALPLSYTFTYDQLKADNSNAIFLNQVDNGYGGSVRFSYAE